MGRERDVMHVRHLRLRAGPGDGQTWAGEIDVGRRIACRGPWSADGVYIVTSETVTAPDGTIETVAVPVESSRDARDGSASPTPVHPNRNRSISSP